MVEAASLVAQGQVHRAMAVVRPPGHHACGGSAAGFCFFGNVAVAAKDVLDRGLAQKVPSSSERDRAREN